MDEPPTFSEAHVKRQRAAHAQADGYGRHRHLYLHDPMRKWAAEIAAKERRPPTLFDYGCGKGGFMEEVRKLGVFGEIAGYDPAVDAFKARPAGRYDLVTCLDVLDKTEPRFIDAVIDDVARFTAGTAIFDIITKPKAASGLKPHPPFYWSHLVGRRMRIVDTRVEFTGMNDFERVVIRANPSR